MNCINGVCLPCLNPNNSGPKIEWSLEQEYLSNFSKINEVNLNNNDAENRFNSPDLNSQNSPDVLVTQVFIIRCVKFILNRIKKISQDTALK